MMGNGQVRRDPMPIVWRLRALNNILRCFKEKGFFRLPVYKSTSRPRPRHHFWSRRVSSEEARKRSRRTSTIWMIWSAYYLSNGVSWSPSGTVPLMCVLSVNNRLPYGSIPQLGLGLMVTAPVFYFSDWASRSP